MDQVDDFAPSLGMTTDIYFHTPFLCPWKCHTVYKALKFSQGNYPYRLILKMPLNFCRHPTRCLTIADQPSLAIVKSMSSVHTHTLILTSPELQGGEYVSTEKIAVEQARQSAQQRLQRNPNVMKVNAT